MIMMKYIVFVLCGLTARASASPSANHARMITTTSTSPASEDLSLHSNERVINDVLTKTIKDYVEPLQKSVENLIKIVEQLNTTALRSDERVASVERNVQNLTQSLGQLSTNVEQLTATALRSNERVASVEGTIQNLTQSPGQLTPRSASSDYEYSNVTGHSYKLHLEKVRWSDADLTCRREGGLLAVVNSREEARVLGEMRRRQIWSTYIGVRKNSAGRWVVVTGEDVVATAGYPVWAAGHPETRRESKYRYGVLFKNNTIGANSSRTRQPFICEVA